MSLPISRSYELAIERVHSYPNIHMNIPGVDSISHSPEVWLSPCAYRVLAESQSNRIFASIFTPR